MIDINTYRSRIGTFVPRDNCREIRQEFSNDVIRRSRSCRSSSLFLSILLLLSLSSTMFAASSTTEEYTPLTTPRHTKCEE